MAWCPFAIRRVLPENATQAKMTPRAVILHTAVDAASPNSSVYGFFARGDIGVESHFYVMDNGTIEQYIDTEVRADANLNANAFAVSIETEDDGHPEQNPWTPDQLTALVKLVDWLCVTHGIPRRQIESPAGSGIGWHAMWGAPSPWTPATGKTCPGASRIAQAKTIVIPRVAGYQESDDVALQDPVRITAPGDRSYHEDRPSAVEVIGDTLFYSADTYKAIGPITEKLDKLSAAVAALQSATDGVIDYDRIVDGVVAKLSALEFKAE